MALNTTSGLEIESKDEELESSAFDTILKEDKKVIEPIEQDIQDEAITSIEDKKEPLFGISEEVPSQVKPEDSTVIKAINEGFSIIEIQQSLVDNFQVTEEEAIQTIISEFQSTVDADIADSSVEEVRQNLLFEHNFPEDIVEQLLVNAKGPAEAKELTMEDINQHLVPVTLLSEDTTINEKSTEQLAVQARAVHQKHTTLFSQIKGAFDDQEAQQDYFKDVAKLNTDIANTIRGLGRNVQITEAGTLVEVMEDGTQVDIDESFFQSLATQANETIGSIGGFATGVRATAPITTKLAALGLPGKAAALLIGGAGGVAGAITGGVVGRTIDVARNAYFVKEELETEFYIQKMKDSAQFEATMGIIAGPTLWAGGQAIKYTAKAFGFFLKGNKTGAMKALKNQLHLEDNTIDEIISNWEQISGKTAPGFTREEKALSIIPQVTPGGEHIVGAATKFSPVMSANISKVISDRAKDVIESVKSATHDNIGSVVRDELNNYRTGVKDFFQFVKDSAKSGMKESDTAARQEGIPAYRFNYDKLTVEPLLKKVQSKLTNPALVERFERMLLSVKEIGGNTKRRGFNDLLDLRSIVNSFKFSSVIKKGPDYDAINSVIKKIDKELISVASKRMPKGRTWLKTWRQSNIEYAKMKQLEKNVLNKALTKPGANPKQIINALTKDVTAIDGTFMQVVSKLPTKIRANVETAILDNLIKKHTVGVESGIQSLHFTNLAQELKHVPFSSSKSRELKRAINETAKVFKNDVDLQAVSGKMAKPGFSTSLTADPRAKAKFEFMSHYFSYLRRLVPFSEKADTLALSMHVARAMKNPRDAKSVKAIIKALPNDPELAGSLRRLALVPAKFGEKETSPYVKIYRTGVPGKAHKAVEGKYGKGIYWTTNKAVSKSKARKIKGKQFEEEILPSRIANEDDIKATLGVDELDPSMIKDNIELQIKLKDRGYDGINIGEDILIFKD